MINCGLDRLQDTETRSMIHTREVATRAVAQMLQQQPMSAAKVRFAWVTVVGAAIARVTAVELDGAGTLHVAAETEPWRREVQRSAHTITRRLADLLGVNAVRRVSVTQKRTS